MGSLYLINMAIAQVTNNPVETAMGIWLFDKNKGAVANSGKNKSVISMIS